MGFFDDTDTAVAEKPEAPKTSGSFFEDTDTVTDTSSSFFADEDSVKIDPILAGAQPEGAIGDDWSGFVANMKIAGNRLGQGIDIARVEQVSGWKNEADEAKRYVDILESKDPNVDVRDVAPLFGSLGGAQLYSLEKAREKYLQGEESSFYENALKTARSRFEGAKKTFEEGAATIPEYVESIAQKEKRIEELSPQLSPEMQQLNRSEGSEFWKTFASNPVESIANVIASSAVVGAPGIALGAIGSIAGPAGTAAGSAYGSFITETSQSMLDSLRESGVDLTNPEKTQAALGDPIIMQKARQIAESRGVAVATFDALTAGLAGKFIGPVLKETAPATFAVVKASGKELAMQMAGGATGELVAQGAAAQEISGKEIGLEALGEIGSGVTETISNLRQSGAPLTAQALQTETKGGETDEQNETQRLPDSTGTQQAGDAQREAERGGEILPTPGVQSPESSVQPSGESGPRTDVPNREEVLTTEGEVPAPAPVPTLEPVEVPQQQESQTPQEPKKVLTPDDRATALQPFLKAAQAAAQASGATDPEDAAQVAWIKVSNSEKPLDNPRAVLIDAARSEAKSQLSKANAQKRGGGLVEGMDVADLENQAVQTRGPRAEAISKEDMDGITKAISTLNTNEKRVAMVRARGEEMTAAEVAEELDLAEGTVRNIDMKLKELLKPYAKTMGYGESLGPGAASAAEVLARYEKRRFATRFQEDAGISEDIRNQSGENYYEPISMVQNAKDAAKLIKERGADSVASEITDPNSDITFAQRVTVGVELLTRLDQQYKAEQESNPEAAKVTLEKAIVLNEWLKQYGTSLGQGINAFKSWSKRLSQHKLIEQLIEANGGEPLTDEQIQLVNDTYKGITETEEKLEDRQAEIETKASDEHADLTLSDLVKEKKEDPLVLGIAERIEAYIKKQADAARARIRDRLQFASAGLDPVVLYDLTWLAAEQIAKGVRKLSQWKKNARSEFGEEVEPYLDQAWEDANANIDRLVEEGSPKEKRDPVTRIVKKMTSEEARIELTKRITTEVKDGGTLKDLVPLIRRLADKFIESGIRTREPLIDALHGVIEPLLPGTSKREVQDAFSGYGQFRELSKDEVSKTRRELAAQSQLASKAEDVLAKRPLLKSGVERPPVSDTQRRMQAELNELKRRFGVVSTDPAKQLKSAQDTIKTRLKNEIKDLARQIETGEKPPQKSQTQWDAEIERLREQKARMQETLSSLESSEVSEEQRIKNAERSIQSSIEEYERRIKNKDTRTPKGVPVESESLTVLRAKRDELKAELDELRAADTALQDEKKFDALMRQAEQLEIQLKTQGPPKPEAEESKAPEDPLVSEARERVKELREQLKAAKASSPESRQAKIDKAIASLESSIKVLDARLRAGDITTKEKSPEVTTPELERLRAERAAMVKELNRQRREAAKPSESEIQAKKDAKQIENLEKSISELTRKINAKDLSSKRPTSKPSTEEAKRLSEYKKYLQDFLNDMRRDARPKRSPEEVAIKALKTRLAKQNADLESRIARGDFSKRTPKTVDFSKDPEAVRLKAENTRIRKEFERKKLVYERQNRTKLQKAFDTGKEILNLPRNIMSSLDFSAVFRQGGMLTFANPVRAAKALGPMLKSAFSEKNFQELQSSIELRPNAKDGTYKKAGLYLAETGDVKLSKKEEAIMSEMGDRLPFVKASNRAYVAFLNKMRADSFDVLYDQLQKNGTATEEELKALGNYVNVATGRGNLGSYNEGAATLALFLFSPRLMVSRFQLLMGQPGWRGSARTRTLIAKEYGKVALALATFTALAIGAGAEWEDDPTSSDFMKLKFGDTRVDPWMGLIQPLVLSARAQRGEVKKGDGRIIPIRGDDVPYGQDDWADLAAKFVRSKLNPSVGGAVDLITGKNVVGEEATPMAVGQKLLTPLSIQDMGKVWMEQGMAKGTALNLMGLLGMGVQNYPKKTSSQEKALEIMASPR